MFIIFGTNTKKIIENKGYFSCPQCQNIKYYRLQSNQSWFTLFFVPIFPIGEKKNNHVECDNCGSTFITRVLENNNFNFKETISDNKEKVIL